MLYLKKIISLVDTVAGLRFMIRTLFYMQTIFIQNLRVAKIHLIILLRVVWSVILESQMFYLKTIKPN